MKENLDSNKNNTGGRILLNYNSNNNGGDLNQSTKIMNSTYA